jgi:hypothetical protein
MNIKRMRGRNHRSNPGGGGGAPIRQNSGNIPLNRNHVFDSSGPDLRIRGTAQQLFEKYLQLGRDATSVGDRVMAESYFQHAEHYFRIIGAINQATQQGSQGQQGQASQSAPPPPAPIAQHNGPRRTLEQELEQEILGDDDAPGMGEQPTLREIPITAAPPVAED